MRSLGGGARPYAPLGLAPFAGAALRLSPWAWRGGCGARRWWPGLVPGVSGFCGGVLWLLSLRFRLGLWFCLAGLLSRRCPRPGGVGWSGRRWRRVRGAGGCGPRAGRSPARLWSSGSGRWRVRRRSLLRGRAGAVSRSRFGASRAGCSASRFRWPCRRRCVCLLPPRSRLPLRGWAVSRVAAAAAGSCRLRRRLPLALACAWRRSLPRRPLCVARAGGARLPPRSRVRAAARPRRAARPAGAATVYPRRAAVAALPLVRRASRSFRSRFSRPGPAFLATWAAIKNPDWAGLEGMVIRAVCAVHNSRSFQGKKWRDSCQIRSSCRDTSNEKTGSCFHPGMRDEV